MMKHGTPVLNLLVSGLLLSMHSGLQYPPFATEFVVRSRLRFRMAAASSAGIMFRLR